MDWSLIDAYVRQALLLQGFNLTPEHVEAIVTEFVRIEGIAAPLLDLPLGVEVEPATVYQL
jgi:hypothetical protein